MKVTPPPAPQTPSPQTKEFSYGPYTSPCQLIFDILLFPCVCSLMPSTAYNKIVFNQEKKQLEKYGKGFGLFYLCCCDRLQRVIGYEEILGIRAEEFTYSWNVQYENSYGMETTNKTDVSVLIIKLKNGKEERFYLPENACYWPGGCTCYTPFTGLSFDLCCRKNFYEKGKEIALHWYNRCERIPAVLNPEAQSSQKQLKLEDHH